MLNSDNIEIVVTKLTVHGTKVRLLGFLKSVFFQFYKGSFEFYAVENGIQGSPIPVSPSTHNYYLSHEPTQRFWKFEYECDAREVQNLWFKVKFDTAELKTSNGIFRKLKRKSQRKKSGCITIALELR